MASPLQELNDDIWLPFGRAYAEADVDCYLGLHAPDFVRVSSEEGIVQDSTRTTDSTRFPAGATHNGDSGWTSTAAAAARPTSTQRIRSTT